MKCGDHEVNIHKIKETISIFITSYISYPIFYKKNQFNILSDEDTVKKIVSERLSVSRYGDGEIGMLRGGSIGFQDSSAELANRLSRILVSREKKLLLCIPRTYNSTKGLTGHATRYQRCFILGRGQKFIEMIDKSYIYGSAGFTRFYADYKNKNKSNIIKKVNAIKSIWEGKNVYFIEGEYTRCGVGNDLFNNAKSISRIICPATNAFAIYDRIIDAAKKTVPLNGDSLIICALGPTATVLAYDLCVLGYQAIDLGHIDIEYEWFCMGAKTKVLIPGKSVNECGSNIPDKMTLSDKYLNEIKVNLV